MTPEFQEKASEVLQAPYWYERPNEQDTRRYVEARQARANELQSLRVALEDCTDYSDLDGEAKASYDRALASLTSADEEDSPAQP